MKTYLVTSKCRNCNTVQYFSYTAGNKEISLSKNDNVTGKCVSCKKNQCYVVSCRELSF